MRTNRGADVSMGKATLLAAEQVHRGPGCRDLLSRHDEDEVRERLERRRAASSVAR